MSELGVAAGDKENPGNTDGCKQPIKYNFCDYFRFQPIRFFQALLAQVGEETGAESQVSNRKRALYVAQRLLVSNPCGSIVIGLFIVGTGYLLYRIGLFTAPGITALASVILAVWAGMTWYTYRGQWRVMERQHSTMQRQLEHAEAAGHKTDQMIEQMQLDNRAWLAAEDMRIKELAKDYNRVIPYVDIKNSGKTPGKVIKIVARHFVKQKGYPQSLIIHEFESECFYRDEVYSVQPNSGINIESEVLGTIPDDDIEKIRIGEMELHILIRFVYRDWDGKTHEEKAFFTAQGSGPQMHHQPNYCAIDPMGQ